MMAAALWKRIGIVTLGGVGGFLYYYFIGCASGTCPITSNPYVSTGYGAMMGAIFAFGPAKGPRKDS